MRRFFIKIGLVMLACSSLGLTFALDPTLSPEEVQTALETGKAMFSPTQGYSVRDYVLFDVPDPLVITPGEGEVEAVVVGTPFERLRYDSYLSNYQTAGMTIEEAAQEAAELENTVHFIVFAHSPGGGGEYQNFLKEFGPATFAVSGGETLSQASVDTFGPAQDAYAFEGTKTEFLWLGYVDYEFDLAPLVKEGTDVSALEGTLAFTDSTGRAYSFQVNLGNYR